MSDRLVLGRNHDVQSARPGKESTLVRCPVCDSATVTVVLDSKRHASCACCGATWIQEGSWQRSIRPARAKAPLPDDVIPLSRQADVAAPTELIDPAEEAVGT